jgi:hypothetical protein
MPFQGDGVDQPLVDDRGGQLAVAALAECLQEV